MKLMHLVAAAVFTPALASAAYFSGTLKLDNTFNGKPARVDYDVTLAADGSMSGNLLRNGSGSPISGVRQK